MALVPTIPENLMGNYYLVADSIYNICGSEHVFLFSKAVFGPGVTMYNDSQLTDPITEGYISRKTFGPIYTVTAGVIDTDTGIGCYNSISGKFGLSNSAAMCNAGFRILYTDATDLADLIGSKMYYDRELMQPVTGFDFLLSALDGTIYSLNDATGEVLSEEVICDDFYNVMIDNNSAERVIDLVVIGNEVFNDDLVPGDGAVGTHTAFSSSIAVKLFGGGSCDSCGTSELKLFKNATSIQTMNVKDGLYNFSPVAYTLSDEVRIELNNVIPAAP